MEEASNSKEAAGVFLDSSSKTYKIALSHLSAHMLFIRHPGSPAASSRACDATQIFSQWCFSTLHINLPGNHISSIIPPANLPPNPQ
jgi:hypothetical protein